MDDERRGDEAKSDVEDVDARPYVRKSRNGSGISSGDGYEQLFSTLTTKDDASYDLSEGVKLAIILNQRVFDNGDLTERRGTDVDCAAIDVTFKGLGFVVRRYDDLTFDKIQSELSELQENRDVELACLVVFVLTHGEENGVLHAKDAPFRLDKHIVNRLLPSECPSLAGKPKLVFVQACQGKSTDPGAQVRVRSRHTSTDSDSLNNYRVPNYADLLVFQAAYHGHYSFRSGKSGSWFIQAVCRAFNESKEDECVYTVLTRAKRYVSLNKESNVPDVPTLDKKRQIPLLQTTLIRDLYLKRGLDQTDLGVLSASTSVRQPFSDNQSTTGSSSGYDQMAEELAATLNSRFDTNKSKKEKCKLM